MGSRGANNETRRPRLFDATAGSGAGEDGRRARRRLLAAAHAPSASCAAAAAPHVTWVCLVGAQRSATRAAACPRDSMASSTPSAAAQANAASSLRGVPRPAHGRCATGRVGVRSGGARRSASRAGARQTGGQQRLHAAFTERGGGRDYTRNESSSARISASARASSAANAGSSRRRLNASLRSFSRSQSR